ncbi:MAG: tetratricopeptide repeat protein [Pseudomonadota bacterium]
MAEPKPEPRLKLSAVQPVAEPAVDHRAAGLFALSTGDGGAAEPHFRTVVEQDPTDTDAWLNLGAALRQQGRAVDAEAALSAALATAARPALLAQSLARDLIDRGADAEALNLLNAYRPAQPIDPVHEAYIAAVLQRVGQHAEAAERYRSVLALRPQAADWWVGLAISDEAGGHRDAAGRATRHARNIGNLDNALARYAEQRLAAIEATPTS